MPFTQGITDQQDGGVARLGGKYATIVNQLGWSSDGLVGFVDLHTHPTAHLGYGTELFYGPPDGDPSQVFNTCRGYHAGWDLLNNREGNDIRNEVVNQIASREYSGPWADEFRGWPDLLRWPTWHDRLHQQVRVEMLERAWQGGLRLLVAHAVNNQTLAQVSDTRGPRDDKSSGDLQIGATKEMVAAQTFMELALTPLDVREIIGRGHLAVVLGVELDSIGNFCSPNKTDGTNAPFNSNPTDVEIQAELERLYSEGVRYFFPIHITDNTFGGAALYEMAFDTANRFEFGQFYIAEPAPQSSEIGFTLDPPTDYWGLLWKVDVGGILGRVVQEQALGFDPESHPPAPYTTTGHRNSRGLQHQGRVALDALTRLGAMIDVDHMGEKTVEETLQHTARAGYPVFAGHNAVRKAGGTERAHIAKVAGEIMDRGGMWGAGIKDGTQSLHATISQLRQLSPNGGIAVGSDCSGMELLPAEREMPSSWPETPTIRDYEAAGFVVYRDLNGAPANALERCKFGNREYDIDFDGFAHIGMYPDFLEDGVSSGHLSEDDLRELFRAPEAFVQAWENCLAAAGRLGPAAVADLSYLVPLLLED